MNYTVLLLLVSIRNGRGAATFLIEYWKYSYVTQKAWGTITVDHINVFCITDVNSAPTITNKLTTPVSVQENVVVGTSVRQYTTTDINGGVLTYSATYSPASGGTYFTIESASMSVSPDLKFTVINNYNCFNMSR